MASIENRSRFVLSVSKRPELEATFAFNRGAALEAYVHKLKMQGLKPKLSRMDDAYAVRIRGVGQQTQTLYAKTAEAAVELKQRLESERRGGLFVDYMQARQVSFGDLLVRYLREEAPRHKGFEVEGYTLNAILEDAGLPRVDLAAAYQTHKNPHPKLAGMTFRKPSGRRMRLPSPAACFVRKPFADVGPDDLNDDVDDRCQAVAASTVDRELDLFAAVCRLAIETWRIPMPQSPMLGVRRPKYFNERDRRLKAGEEERLLEAAHAEDVAQAIACRLEELMSKERAESLEATTVYQRKGIIKAAREDYRKEAEGSYAPAPWFETFSHTRRRPFTGRLAFSSVVALREALAAARRRMRLGRLVLARTQGGRA